MFVNLSELILQSAERTLDAPDIIVDFLLEFA